jgi:hypothetical protein
MSEKYYVVSDEEMKQVIATAIEISVCDYDDLVKAKSEFDTAEAACRARPVVQDVSGVWLSPIEEASDALRWASTERHQDSRR